MERKQTKRVPSTSELNYARFLKDWQQKRTLLVFSNPSGQQFAVQFTLEENTKVKINVTDHKGHLIKSLPHQSYPPVPTRWNGTAQPSGVYLIQITQGNQCFTRKVVLK